MTGSARRTASARRIDPVIAPPGTRGFRDASRGPAPMCATVGPAGVRCYGTVEELQAERSGVEVSAQFSFGDAEVATGVAAVVPAERRAPVPGGLLPLVEVNGRPEPGNGAAR
ncbi:hypothetical protein KSNIM_31370 [Kitasatospora sp. DSM 101779]|nr:hypothetical protein [Kitasatospora sp. DSM 101779]